MRTNPGYGKKETNRPQPVISLRVRDFSSTLHLSPMGSVITRPVDLKKSETSIVTWALTALK